MSRNISENLEIDNILDFAAMTKEFQLTVPIKIRISDINYGNHVGYDRYFTFFQEARIAYLNQFGFSELDIGGFGMMVSDAGCRYKRELNMGDAIEVQCRISHLKKKAFVMAYRILRNGKICATGSTTNICYDYHEKKIADWPPAFIRVIREFEGIKS